MGGIASQLVITPASKAAARLLLGQVDIRTFGLNLYLVIGALVVGLVMAVLILVAWTMVKCFIWETKVRRARIEADRIAKGPDGRPLPPSGRGLCDICEKPFDKVYHLPTGRRVCEGCYSLITSPPRDPQSPSARPRRRRRRIWSRHGN